MKRTLSAATLLAAATFAGSASAEIIASWDNWADTNISGGLAADATATGVTAFITDADGAFSSNNGGLRDISGSNGSTDGTFGTLAGASGAEDGAARLAKGGTAITLNVFVTVVNGTGGDLDLAGLSFDFGPNSNSFDSYSVTFNNETLATTTGVLGSGGPLSDTGGNADYHDIDINASGITLAAGQTGSFIIEFDNSDGVSSSSFIDNVAVSIVPEPGSLALLGLGGLFVLRRRRS